MSFLTSLIPWISSAIVYGTVIMFGALGEILTEKSGHLNLGVPGLMFLGAFSSFAAAFLYESKTEEPSTAVMILLPLTVGFVDVTIGAAVICIAATVAAIEEVVSFFL